MNTAHAADLILRVDDARVEYGKPVWLTIESAQRDVQLATLDFDRWQHDVVLLTEQEVQTDTAAGVQRWRVRLYPRRQGRIELPGLMFAGEQSAGLSLEVVPATDPKTGTPIDIDCRTSTHTPYQQQQVIVGCNVRMQDELVLFDYPRRVLAGAQLLPMQVSAQTPVSATTAANTLHQPGWVVIPQRSGAFAYELPPLQLVRDGVITHRFYLPILQLEVQPLPLYLPGTIPVGHIQVTRYALADTLLRPAQLSQIHLHVTVSGVPAEAIPDYAQSVHSDATLQTYAAKKQHRQRVDALGIQHELDYTIPLTPQRQGLHALPDLRLQYFDPHTGTLHALHVPGQHVLILSWWARLVLALLVAVPLGVGVRYLVRHGRQVFHRWRTYRAALEQLAEGPTLVNIRYAMSLMAQAERWSANLTYGQWYAKMVQRHKQAGKFPYQQLYETSYAGRLHDLQTVHGYLQHICRRRMYRLM